MSTGLSAADRGGYLVKDRDLIAIRSRYPVAGTVGYWEACGLSIEHWNFSFDRHEKEFRNPRTPENKKVMCEQMNFTKYG